MGVKFVAGTFVAVVLVLFDDVVSWLVRVEIVDPDGQPGNAYNEGVFKLKDKDKAIQFAASKARALGGRLMIEVAPPLDSFDVAQYI